MVLCSVSHNGKLPLKLKVTTKLIEFLVNLKLKVHDGQGGYQTVKFLLDTGASSNFILKHLDSWDPIAGRFKPPSFHSLPDSQNLRGAHQRTAWLEPEMIQQKIQKLDEPVPS